MFAWATKGCSGSFRPRLVLDVGAIGPADILDALTPFVRRFVGGDGSKAMAAPGENPGSNGTDNTIPSDGIETMAD